jgi:hypothetical protein
VARVAVQLVHLVEVSSELASAHEMTNSVGSTTLLPVQDHSAVAGAAALPAPSLADRVDAPAGSAPRSRAEETVATARRTT